MTPKKVHFAHVKYVASKLESGGEKLTAERIRQFLGSGPSSLLEIQKHINEYRRAHTAKHQDFATELAFFMRSVFHIARETDTFDMEELQGQMDELIRTCEAERIKGKDVSIPEHFASLLVTQEKRLAATKAREHVRELNRKRPELLKSPGLDD